MKIVQTYHTYHQYQKGINDINRQLNDPDQSPAHNLELLKRRDALKEAQDQLNYQDTVIVTIYYALRKIFYLKFAWFFYNGNKQYRLQEKIKEITG